MERADERQRDGVRRGGWGLIIGIGEEEDDEWRARLWSERKIRRCGRRRKGSPGEELTKEEEG